MTDNKISEAAAYYNSLPRKRTGAGMLIFNKAGQLLVVKPTYQDKWLCPGGAIEEAESPLDAAVRECKEEIGVVFDEVWPAYISYLGPFPDGQTDIVQFMFTTNPVDEDFLGSLTLGDGEIAEAKFIDPIELPKLFSPMRAKVVANYCRHREGRRLIYMQEGEIIC